MKLHSQFGHAKTGKIIPLLKETETHEEGDEGILEKIQEGCKGCLLRSAAAARPSTSLPPAKEFNDKIALDLKRRRE